MYTINELLKVMGKGHMANTAYDTAWIARLNEIDSRMSNDALGWISENQLSDGSWGVEKPSYYHDRVISSLATMIALNYRGRRAHDRAQIESGLLALEKITSGATEGLRGDIRGATVGFEMIVPTLVSEAEKLGIIKQQGDQILGRLSGQRALKMEKLKGLKISRYITASLSIEMAGTDAMHFLDPDSLQEPNGSVGNSPSATAYFALHVRPGDEKALNYLRSVVNEGGAPFVSPFDVFERAWILWNLSLIDLNAQADDLVKGHLDFLDSRWVAGHGISFTTDSMLFDSDDSSVTFEVLARFGRLKDAEALISYEGEKWFRCYPFEVDASTGANLHILGALRQAGYQKDHPLILKIIQFLAAKREPGGYWFDKWHTSPYYITSHAIILCREYANDLCEVAVNWMISTQKADGSWGFFGFSTAEETAYCIQSLIFWRRSGGKIPLGRLELAIQWLRNHAEPPYPWLWIGKTLYYPELLVQSSILSALALADEG